MILQVTPEELQDHHLVELGKKFYAEEKLPGGFVPEVFVNTWSTLMRLTMGAIWCCTISGKPVGAFGGVLHPDANDGKLVAQEMFWFMDHDHRDGFNAVRLYCEFEKWAQARGASRIVMGCILNQHASSLRNFYTKRGYRPVDVSYFKDL